AKGRRITGRSLSSCTGHQAARRCYLGRMSEVGGKHQPNPSEDSRDERLAAISNTLAQMSSQLTDLAQEVRDLQGPALPDEQQYQQQRPPLESQTQTETPQPTKTPASDT